MTALRELLDDDDDDATTAAIVSTRLNSTRLEGPTNERRAMGSL